MGREVAIRSGREIEARKGQDMINDQNKAISRVLKRKVVKNVKDVFVIIKQCLFQNSQ